MLSHEQSEHKETPGHLTGGLKVLIHSLISNVPSSSELLEKNREETANDVVLVHLQSLVQEWFPETTTDLPVELKQYQKLVSELYKIEGLLFLHNKILVTQTMSLDIILLASLHERHFGREKY